jgi:hypothetical protein
MVLCFVYKISPWERISTRNSETLAYDERLTLEWQEKALKTKPKKYLQRRSLKRNIYG